MSDETTNPAAEPGFSVDDLIAEATANVQPTFEIRTANGRVLTFRTVTDGSEVVRIRKYADECWEAVKMGGMPAAPDSPSWQPWCKGADKSIVDAAAWLETLSVSPKFSFVDGLKMGKQAGPLLMQIFVVVQYKASLGMMLLEQEEIDALKNA